MSPRGGDWMKRTRKSTCAKCPNPRAGQDAYCRGCRKAYNRAHAAKKTAVQERA